MIIDIHSILPIGVAFAGTLALTPLVRTTARRYGYVASPQRDRWHERPTALLGGIAIFLTVMGTGLLFFPWTPQTMALAAGGSLLWGVGLIDDLRSIKPYQKLIAQLMAAALVISFGLVLPWTVWPLVNMAITVLWLVGITNALNLLDNMDGLAAGIGGIASVFLALNFLENGQAHEALLLAVLAAALFAFLVYNTNPASIFMGDCGSMFIGFFLAGAALLNVSGGRSHGLLPVLGAPVLTLLIPIFDTTLVTVLRKLAGRPVSQGGRDHTSHRLVALGMSQRGAVALLYGFAMIAGLLGLSLHRWDVDVGLAVILGLTVMLTFLGVHLGGVKVYDEAELRAARQQPLVAFLVDLSHKRRVFEVLLDVALIVFSYYLASGLLFGPLGDSGSWRPFLQVLPVLVALKLGAFLVTGVYRGVWRYVTVDDLLVHARAVGLGAALSIPAVLVAFRFEGFSPAVFLLDGLILFVLLAGSRIAFRLLRRMLPGPAPVNGRRVLIYGADDEGELVLRTLQRTPELECLPVGFADDDPRKAGQVIHGLRVFGGTSSVLRICREHDIDEVIVPHLRFTNERLDEIARDCRSAGLELKCLRLHLESVRDAAPALPATAMFSQTTNG